MLQTIIRCDSICDSYEIMFDDIPDRWVRWNGRHYCSPLCFGTDVRDGGE